MQSIDISYILSLVNDFLSSKEGKEYVSDFFLTEKDETSSILSKNADVSKIVDEIKEMLFDAITREIHSFHNSRDAIKDEPSQTEGKPEIVITIDKESLHRSSLHYMNAREYKKTGKLTIGAGSGVQDIVALFVHGYTLKSRRRPFGFWVHEGGASEEYVGARRHRDPSDFLDVLIANINAIYKEMCTAYLDEKYKR